jgi:predicted Zn-dependent protease
MAQRLCSSVRLALCVCALAGAGTAHAADQRERIARVVDDLKTQLAITQTIDVSIVEANPTLFSVAPAEPSTGTFLLSVEEDFAQGLSEAELRAAVAHELGHVWIFTHFPYLQTEQLANDIAARVVGRETLAPLYDKVWKARAASQAKMIHQ